MRKFAILSLLAAIVFAVLFFRSVPLTSGEGQSGMSPNGALEADAFLLVNDNPIAASPRISYEFTIRQKDGPVIRRAVFYPAQDRHTKTFRGLSQIIVWSPDSASVTFTLPDVTLRLDIAAYPAPPAP